MRVNNKHFGCAALLLAGLLLTACGGGGGNGGGDPASTNLPPTVTAAPVSIPEGATVSVVATASDADGSIASYRWQQKSGVALALSATDTATISITAPEVTADSTAVLAVTVTDNDGAQATAELVVTILAGTTSFTVTGLVTDNPVADAEIEFHVGTQVFSTRADASGRYSIALDVDDSNLSEVIRAEATSSNPELKLVSLLGDVASVLQDAGEDGILTRGENLSVNISNLTTALAAQLERGVPGSITSQREMIERTKTLDGNMVFQLATLIKLVLDYSDNTAVAMPENIADTYALASDNLVAAELVARVQREDASVYQAAMNAIAADNELVAIQPPTSSTTEDTYYFTTTSIMQMPFENAVSEHFGYRLQVDADGKGILSGRQRKREINWNINADGMVISGGEVVVDTRQWYDSYFIRDVVEETVVRPRSIKWLASGSDVDWLLITLEKFIRYPNGEYPSTDPDFITGATVAIREKGIVEAKNVLPMGLAISVPLPFVQGEVTDPSTEYPTPELSVQAVQLIFNGSVETGGSVTINKDSISGSGKPSQTQLISSWTIDERGHLQITDLFGYPAELVFLQQSKPKAPIMFVELNFGAEQASIVQPAYLREAPAWTAERAIGIYQYSVNFFWPLQPFWFEVNADGSALTVSGWDENNDGELTENEFAKMPGLWQINSEGNLIIRRYVSIYGGFCAPVSWNPAPTEDCVLYHEREWVLHQESADGGVALRHYHRYFHFGMDEHSSPVDDEHLLMDAIISNTYYERVSERPYPISQ
ncbi:PKD domain-containing protein [Microbulbifer pacificus]|uniref:PKD domain-containing protein n=1 Tax=Microbulbifer pacificus TaxID=407164 RepID=UPI001319DAFE|nr:hypothetical protein [Microbulbifer pacificus]